MVCLYDNLYVLDSPIFDFSFKPNWKIQISTFFINDDNTWYDNGLYLSIKLASIIY